ncbi:MAG: Uma2 family endonuclease [Treponema sp.]|nr:Uma2 family endonuclease [Treponema sp.]
MPGSALLKEEYSYTYAEYKDWDLSVHERFELIDGVPHAMAGPTVRHQAILGELFRQISNYLMGQRCKVYPAPLDVRLFYEEDESDDTVVQPDIVVICEEKKRGPEGCRGAPEFTIEILSPSNSAIEMERKFELYRDAGVKEYWVVDPENKRVRGHRFKEDEIITHLYTAGDSAPIEVLGGIEIDLGPVFAE